MSEETLKRRVISDLTIAGLDPHSVENSVHPGTPDVDFIGGWVELKHADRWPVRGGPLRIEHFTPQQRVWLQRRWHAGGIALFLLQVGTDYILLDGCTAARFVGDCTRPQLEALALKTWKRRMEGLAECVTRVSPPTKSCTCGAELRDRPRPKLQRRSESASASTGTWSEAPVRRRSCADGRASASRRSKSA